jgi:D-sedoheptulose 7-phosphate isomerase
MTGNRPNPLADRADEALAVRARTTAVVQEVHLAAVHALCAAVDAHLPIVAAADDRVLDRQVPA